MTRLAMAREFDAALVDEVFDVLLIKRLAEAVAMRGFLSLCMRTRMTFGAAT
jgi:hypothetical protein